MQYLHRTLKDYIEQPEVWNEICAQTPLFSPLASLCKAFALEIKGINYNISDDYENDEDYLEDNQCKIPELLAGAMFICTLADGQQTKALIHCLDALDLITTRKFAPRRDLRAILPWKPPLLISLATRYDLYFWVKEQFKRGCPVGHGRSGAPLLFVAVDNDDFLELSGLPLDMEWDRQRVRHRPSVMCAEALLSHGADPNEIFEGTTAWKFVVNKLSEILYDPACIEYPEHTLGPSNFLVGKNLAIGEWVRVAELFVWHGASTAVLRKATTDPFFRFARKYGKLYLETGYLERISQLLEVDYGNLEIGDSADSSETNSCEKENDDTGNPESDFELVVVQQNSRKRERKRKRID